MRAILFTDIYNKLRHLRREEENCLMDVKGRHIRRVRLPISQR